MSDLLTPACDACAAWEGDAQSAIYRAGCDECDARELAGSPAAWRAARGVTDVELKDGIERVFGMARYAHGRLLVWQWMKRLGVVKA